MRIFGVTIATGPQVDCRALDALLTFNGSSLKDQINSAGVKSEATAQEAKTLASDGQKEIKDAEDEFNKATRDLQIVRNKKINAANGKIATSNDLNKKVKAVRKVLDKLPSA